MYTGEEEDQLIKYQEEEIQPLETHEWDQEDRPLSLFLTLHSKGCTAALPDPSPYWHWTAQPSHDF